MIVIAIIGILMAIAVTGFTAAMRSANETAAISTLKAIATDQGLYFNGHQRNAFGTFDEMLKFGLLNSKFAGTSPVVSGYIFTMRVIPKSATEPPGYVINADPQQADGVGATGKNHYYVDNNTNTIHVNNTQPATVNDPPI
jgi:type II secretory pathway pseudopilin PulG